MDGMLEHERVLISRSCAKTLSLRIARECGSITLCARLTCESLSGRVDSNHGAGLLLMLQQMSAEGGDPSNRGGLQHRVATRKRPATDSTWLLVTLLMQKMVHSFHTNKEGICSQYMDIEDRHCIYCASCPANMQDKTSSGITSALHYSPPASTCTQRSWRKARALCGCVAICVSV